MDPKLKGDAKILAILLMITSVYLVETTGKQTESQSNS